MVCYGVSNRPEYLPVLYGERMEGENVKGDRLRAGISEVIDGGQEVIVLFLSRNTNNKTI